MLVADNPSSEGGLEGASQFAENSVRLIEDSPATSNSAWQSMQTDSASISNAFPNGSVSSNGIEFSATTQPPLAGMESSVSQAGLPNVNQQLSSIVQAALQTPGLGFLSAVFQFISAVFTSAVNAALDPNLIGQMAQSSFDLKKFMQK